MFLLQITPERPVGSPRLGRVVVIVFKQTTAPLPTAQRASTAGMVVRHRYEHDILLALMRALVVIKRRILGEDMPEGTLAKQDG
jgi:hypothetical protein